MNVLQRTLTLRGVAALAVWLMVAGAGAALLARQQAESRRGIEERFSTRAEIAGRFVATYVEDAVAREVGQGERHLSGERVSVADFNRVVRDDGFTAAVLLNARGELLRVFPHRPGLIGSRIAPQYEHLSAAVRGEVAISKVVPSAALGEPIVGFAVPFDTPSGRRVYSGAQDVGSTAAGSYLRNAVSLAGSRLYLIDPAGAVIADNGRAVTGVRTLAALEPELARALGREESGEIEARGESQRYVSSAIAGTPWRVVVSAPSEKLFASVNGAATWLPWLVFGAFLFASLAAIGLIARQADVRRRLRAMNAALEEAIRVDPLTGLPNRRGLDEHMTRSVSAARRHGHPLAVLMIDVDHFKRLNDTHGHQTGDVVLAALSGRMEHLLRAEDMLGRWGGEEFMAILPETDLKSAMKLAERMRASVAGLTFAWPGQPPVTITVSIGVSVDALSGADDRIAAADRALYAAKAAGRDCVVADAPASATVTD